jgi:hypothetical protein
MGSPQAPNAIKNKGIAPEAATSTVGSMSIEDSAELLVAGRQRTPFDWNAGADAKAS